VPMVLPTAITTVDAPVQASATPVATGVPAPVPAALAQLVGQQLGGPVAALARAGNGMHQITVHLRPAELGAVQVVATFGDAGTTVQLRAGTEATREVMRAALAALDTDLAAAGLQGTSVEVSDEAPAQHPGTGHPGDGAGRRQALPAEHPGGTGRNRDAGPVPPAAGRTGPSRGRALDIHV
jgi:flagellar hook-length control protein FliK